MRRVRAYASRIRTALHDSLTQDSTPREIALSFAVGTFITMLPTFGLGLVVFVVLGRLFGWVNKIALFASVLVFNPAVKWGVYAASFALGFVLLGPVAGFAVGDTPSLGDGSEIVLRLLIGNAILAVVATGLSYVVVYRLIVVYERRSPPIIETVVQEAVEELDPSPESQPPTEDTHSE